ncbi:MAG: type I glyceraldehyde-3-phosphate dehydrogenase [bacterium]
MNIAINGFGRIGRATFKALLTRPGLKVVAINDLTDTKTLAYLLKYDTAYGQFDRTVSFTKNALIIDGRKLPVIAEPDPTKLPWSAYKVDVVIESTGRFRDSVGVKAHLRAGAKKVIISAPGKGDDIPTIVLGVNEKDLHRDDKVISMASCTTNCLSPVTKLIRSQYGIKEALMTTIHGYTADQNLVDGPHKDLRRGRAAGANMVPTTTGAAIAVTKTIPSLKGSFDGVAIRVPVIVGSLCDTVYVTKKPVTADKVNKFLAVQARKPKYKNIVEVSNEAIVSSDIIGNPHSAVVDTAMTKVMNGHLLKIMSWYDNEWGYSNRLADLCLYIKQKKLY